MSSPRQKSGYRYGSATFHTEEPFTSHGPLTVPGESIANCGFELLAGDGVFVSWFACILDAVDALKVLAGPGKIVRCSDRALMKSRRRA